jgi:hypothetical protein
MRYYREISSILRDDHLPAHNASNNTTAIKSRVRTNMPKEKEREKQAEEI